jgi:hypothetical protein
MTKKKIYKKIINPTKMQSIRTPDWIDLYHEYYEFDNRIVKIFSLQKNGYKINMELIEGFRLDDWSKIDQLSWDEKIFILHEIADIFNKHLKFKSKYLSKGEIFYHNDYVLCNIWYCNGVVKLLDPESFIKLDLQDKKELGSRYFGNCFEALSTFRSAITEIKNG